MADEYDAIGPVNALGDELRAWRQRAGLTLADLGPKLCLSAPMVGAMERGCDEAFNTPGTFERLWARAAKHAVPSNASPYYDLEVQATRIHKWELRCIPGLLQTEDYARAIMRTGLPRGVGESLDHDVKMRIDRQGILTSDNPPLAWFIIDESVLHKPYGNMKKQITHIAEVAELPNIVIQISAVLNERPSWIKWATHHPRI